MKFVRLAAVMITLLAGSVLAETVHAKELVVYSARNEHLVAPLFEAYTKETGVEIKYVTDKAGPLMQRLKAEGRHTPADLLITVDAGNLWHAAEAGLLQPVESSVLRNNVPANLRDPANRWFGLSLRARTIVYSTERVRPEELSTYAALGDAAWRDRLLLRTSKKVYNQSLVAMMIEEYGAERTEQIVQSWVDNLAAAPFSSDTKVMEAIVAGQGDVAIVNTYYFGRLLRDQPDLKLALFWPNQDQAGSGVHVNVSGAGITRHSDAPDEARRLLEWLSSAAAQNLFADANLEYPVNPAVEMSAAVAAWGDFTPSPFNLSRAGELQEQAIRLMDRAGYR